MRGRTSRILGIDYGERRIGLALSDPTRTIATPLPPIVRRRGKRPPLQRILEIAKAEGVAEFVVGLPVESSGEEGVHAAEVRRFGAELQRRSRLPVHFQDERLTTVRAERTLRELGLKASERRVKARADTIAACLILQSHLDAASRS